MISDLYKWLKTSILLSNSVYVYLLLRWLLKRRAA